MGKNGGKKGDDEKDGDGLSRSSRLDKLAPLPAQDEKDLDALLITYQERLTRIQHAYLFNSERAVIVFEGVDAAGKGGTIRRIAWALDPRSLHVWPIGSPNEIERRQHYLQRFWQRALLWNISIIAQLAPIRRRVRGRAGGRCLKPSDFEILRI